MPVERAVDPQGTAGAAPAARRLPGAVGGKRPHGGATAPRSNRPAARASLGRASLPGAGTSARLGRRAGGLAGAARLLELLAEPPFRVG
ncbi:hypothetical protein LT493_44425 [Streptomyces tricolor]|nr:hypothetical protein [Streptomyces tricolor]